MAKKVEPHVALTILEQRTRGLIERESAMANALRALGDAHDAIPGNSRHPLGDAIHEIEQAKARLAGARKGIETLRSAMHIWPPLQRHTGEKYEIAVAAIVDAWLGWSIDGNRQYEEAAYTRRSLGRRIENVKGMIERLSKAWMRTPRLSDIRLIDLIPEPVPDTVDWLDEPLPRVFARLTQAIDTEIAVIEEAQTIPNDANAGMALAYHLTYNLHVAIKAVAHTAIAEIASVLSGQQVAEPALRRAWDRSLFSK